MIGVICMAFSMIITTVVSLFTKAPETVETAFEDREEKAVEKE